MRRFVLFDIDGTLVRPGAPIQRIHMSSMAQAITAVAGIRETFRYVGGQLFYGDVDCAGFTDAGTVYAALARHGVPAAEIDALADIIIAEMQRRVTGIRPRRPVGSDADCLLPGCRNLLQGLVSDGVAVGLSTGNAPAVAAWKMRCTGLADLLRVGGFGHSTRDRRHVVANAVATMAAGEAAASVLIGDTTSDVRAARAAGIHCIAVATGAARAEVLSSAEPDAVVEDLTDSRMPQILARLLRIPTVEPRLTGAAVAWGDEERLPAR